MRLSSPPVNGYKVFKPVAWPIDIDVIFDIAHKMLFFCLCFVKMLFNNIPVLCQNENKKDKAIILKGLQTFVPIFLPLERRQKNNRAVRDDWQNNPDDNPRPNKTL
jgi:hypothetical protein